MLEPTQELLNHLPEIAKTYFAQRLERIKSERMTLSRRISQNKSLNQRIVMQKVKGELSSEDFDAAKATIAQEISEAEAQLNVMDAESHTMEQLLEETQRSIVDLARSWREGNTQHRQELCLSLFPEGLRYSQETKFFEPHNVWLMNSMQEMIDRMEHESLVGVPDGI
jgi:chromosome segregation ATPase